MAERLSKMVTEKTRTRRRPQGAARKKNGQRNNVPYKFNTTRRRRLLSALEDGLSMTGAAEHADISREAVNVYRKKHEDFEALVDEAIEAGTDKLEDEAHRRALTGINEPVIWQGKTSVVIDSNGNKYPLTIKKYSDTLLMFLLNGRRSEKYKHRHAHEHTGKDGGPIELRTFADVAHASTIPLGEPANDQGKRPGKQRKRA